MNFNERRAWGPAPRYPKVLAVPKTPLEFMMVAGPCSIESADQISVVAEELKRLGVTWMRGGVYRGGRGEGLLL